MNLKVFLYHKKEALKRYMDRERNGYCNVLLYHRVKDLKSDPQQLCVGTHRFQQQLSSLKKDHAFLSIDEFCDIITNRKKFPKNSLLITFDDGYADNYENALPVLEALDLQSVFYIATKTINTDSLFWWDEVDLVFNSEENSAGLNDLAKKYNQSDKKSFYGFYLEACKMATSLERRNDLLSDLRNFTKLPKNLLPDYKSLSLEQLKKLSASKNAVIGGHTINHLALGCLSEKDQRFEITESLKILSEILNKKITHFSFPYGEKKHYSDTTINVCKELKLQSAAANYYYYVKPSDDIYSFPRVVVRNDSVDVLRDKLKQLAS
ncbi:MAG: polysaccharide deacetylase [Bacteroidetes bacterium]|nr:polysaccharide deacetylase [Bacteroidota bacterium]